jgi:hypothetical protein
VQVTNGVLIELSNVFKIKDGKNVHVFRTEKPSDKRSLLASFREVASEFSAKKRKQRETEHERRRSVWAANGVWQFVLYTVVLSTSIHL